VVMLAIVLFLICENVVSAMSNLMKFLLSLFFLISSKEKGNRSAGEVESGKIVKKLDSRLITYVDLFLFRSIMYRSRCRWVCFLLQY
jgi:hypothetical protein